MPQRFTRLRDGAIHVLESEMRKERRGKEGKNLDEMRKNRWIKVMPRSVFYANKEIGASRCLIRI